MPNITGTAAKVEKMEKGDKTWWVVTIENDDEKIKGSTWSKPAIKEGERVEGSYETKGNYKNWSGFKIPDPSTATASSGRKMGGQYSGFPDLTRADYEKQQAGLVRQGLIGVTGNLVCAMIPSIKSVTPTTVLKTFDTVYSHLYSLVVEGEEFKSENPEPDNQDDDETPAF